ncbi:MAG: diaminopimelate decarboxylase [Oligoflexia bacterium]|nr:diaminopimelate decarboxylase [Oligoflexia bacterium]
MTKKPVKYVNKKLKFMGIDLGILGRKNKTPVYIYSKKRIGEKLEILKEAFTKTLGIHYSVKANSNRQVLKFLKAQKIGVDVVSGGEVTRALECGFKGRDIIFSGVGKSEEEITATLKIGIYLFNVESPQELDRIARVARRLKKCACVSFRLNPNVDAKTHPYITTGFRENKFGMDKKFIPELLKILKRNPKNLKLIGLDFHIGSQLTEINPYEAAFKKSVPVYQELQRQGFALSHFDIGGGIGISYERQKTIDLKKFGKMVESYLKPLGCKILCEPGRFLVGDAGVLLAQVEYVKKTPYKTFVILNTGMHHLIRPALYNSYHEILPVNQKGGKTINLDVVGPICESSDWLAKNRKLVIPSQGDLWAICDVGAYGYVMASDYNLHKKPIEILI